MVASKDRNMRAPRTSAMEKERKRNGERGKNVVEGGRRAKSPI